LIKDDFSPLERIGWNEGHRWTLEVRKGIETKDKALKG